MPAGQARLLPRRQARQASDRLRPALRPGGPSGGRPGLRGQHGRLRLRGCPGREAHRALLALAGRRGRRPGDADRRPHPRGPRSRGAAVDHLAAGSGDPQARFRRRPAAVDLRRAGPGRGLRARALSGRAAGRLPQPAARGRARAQARGAALQDHRDRRRLLLRARRAAHRRRVGARRYLRDPHQRARRRDGARRHGPRLQEPQPGRARLPQLQAGNRLCCSAAITWQIATAELRSKAQATSPKPPPAAQPAPRSGSPGPPAPCTSAKDSGTRTTPSPRRRPRRGSARPTPGCGR